MPKSNNTVKTPIIDKNGKPTHVHKKDPNSANSEAANKRVGSVAVPVRTFEETAGAIRNSPLRFVQEHGGRYELSDDQKSELLDYAEAFSGATVALVDKNGTLGYEVSLNGYNVARVALSYGEKSFGKAEMEKLSDHIAANLDSINAELGEQFSLSVSQDGGFDVVYRATVEGDDKNVLTQIDNDGGVDYLLVYGNNDHIEDDDFITEAVRKSNPPAGLFE